MKYLIALIPLVALTACERRTINGDDLADGSYAGQNNANYTPLTDEAGQPIIDGYGNVVVDPRANPFSGTIESNPKRIVLTDYSQEQQQRDRKIYATQMDAIESQRVTYSASDVASVSQINTGVNVIEFARTTNNRVGEKLYSRSGKKGSCRFSSNDAAQRKFLENGGPQSDPLGLDPDGDGFACKFDPSYYRSLRY